MSVKPATEFVSAPPVFFLNQEAPDNTSHAEFCAAAEKLTGVESIVGCQRIGQVWRLYPATVEVRARLVGKKILLKGKSIPLSSQNPLNLRNGSGREVPNTKLTIDGVFTSVSSVDLQGYLEKAGARLRSPIFWERAWTTQGFSRWFTGRRFVYIDLPTSPLPLAISLGDTYASLYYRERPKGVFCFRCGVEGHRRGDPVRCKAQTSSYADAAVHATTANMVSSGEASQSSEEASEEVDTSHKEEGSDIESIWGDSDVTCFETDKTVTKSDSFTEDKDDSSSGSDKNE